MSKQSDTFFLGTLIGVGVSAVGFLWVINEKDKEIRKLTSTTKAYKKTTEIFATHIPKENLKDVRNDLEFLLLVNGLEDPTDYSQK